MVVREVLIVQTVRNKNGLNKMKMITWNRKKIVQSRKQTISVLDMWTLSDKIGSRRSQEDLEVSSLKKSPSQETALILCHQTIHIIMKLKHSVESQSNHLK